MRLELAEKLICPAAHETTPLIVVALETVERDLRQAQLGCMICHRQGEVRDGSVLLGATTGDQRHEPTAPCTEETLLRLAALLGLTEPNALVLLGERYASYASALVSRHDAIVAVYGAMGASPANVGYLRLSERRVPFATGSFAAVALDHSMSAETVADAVRCVRIAGRVVGETGVPLPLNVRELARDADGWVGEVEAVASPVIPLRRA